MSGDAPVPAQAEFNVASIETCVALVVSLDKALGNRVLSNTSTSDSVELTSAISKKLRKLHSLIVADGEHCDIAVTLTRTNFFSTISCSVSTILKFPIITDEVLRVVLPLVRLQQPEIKRNVMAQLLANGGLIFALLALKQHMQQSGSIRVQGGELLSSILDYVTKVQQQQQLLPETQEFDRQQHTLNRQTTTKYPANSLQRRVAGVQDTVHQLLLHGAAATLCRLLTLSVGNMHEMSVRRAISCIMFLLLETPPELATKVASYDGWSVITALHTVLREMSLSARVDAATLLTGLLSSDINVAERIYSLGIWDELSSTLAQNASVVRLPKQWLRDSLDKIRLVNDKAGGGHSGGQSFSPYVLKREEPTFSYSFGFDGGAGLVLDEAEGSMMSSIVGTSAGFEDVVTALLDTHAAVDTGTRKPPTTLGMLSAKHLEAQLQRHVTKAKQSFSGFGEIEQTYTPAKRPQSASMLKKSKDRDAPAERNYIKNLKTSPLGHPIDPAQYRKEMRAHGGQLPEYVPAALGGKGQGKRPGAATKDKAKDKSKNKTSVDARLGVVALPADPSKQPKKRLGPGNSLSTPALLASSNGGASFLQTQAGNANADAVHSNTKATNFVAQRLFTDEDGNTAPVPSSTSRPHTASAIDRLSFAERLQCMILQVKDKMAVMAQA